MDQPQKESISIEDAAGLLLQTRKEQPEQQESNQPEEASQEEEQVLPFETEAEEDGEGELSEAEVEEEDQSVEEIDEGEEEEQDVYTVNVGGEEIDVTLDEALKGYAREKDYTRKTQQLASERRDFEANQTQFQAEQNQLQQERAQTAQLRDAYAQTLQQLETQAQQGLEQEPDWDRAYQELDAKEYARLTQNWQARKDNLQKIQIEQARVSKERARETETMMKQHLSQQSALLLQKLPRWNDEKIRSSETQEVIKHAKKIGYTDDEIANAADHRAIVTLYDSWRMAKQDESKVEAKKKVRKAPRMAKAGVPRSKNEVAQRRKDKLRREHAEKGTVQSAVNLLLNR